MRKIITFVLWPMLAGLVFAFTLLLAPRLVALMPGLAGYFPQSAALVTSASPTTSYSDAIRKAAPAVVSINFQHEVERPGRVYLNQYFSVPATILDSSNSLGSGVIVHPEGYIVTSYHILANQESPETLSPDIIVTLSDGNVVDGRVVWTDVENDLAILKVDVARELPALGLADLGRLRIGDVVLAIGNPRNLGQSVSLGIISALLGRDDSFMIQTDAAINPGNSGGALIDTNGNLIGINSTIVSESGGSEGISFAIPASLGMELLDEFFAEGQKGYLGVDTEVLTLQAGRARFNHDVQGFLVNEVAANSPAERGGIHEGDIITGVNGTKLEVVNDADTAEAFKAIAAISNLPPGESITIEVFRDGEFLPLTAVLGAGQPQVYKVPEFSDGEVFVMPPVN